MSNPFSSRTGAADPGRLMDPTAILVRFLDAPRVARVRAVLDTYGRAAGGLLANGLAFSALFAAIPTTLLVLGTAGWIAGDPGVRDRVTTALTTAFPPIAALIESSLEAIQNGAALTSILGIVGLIWTVSQLYGALDVAFARIFSDDPERDIVRRTARGLLVVAILTFAIVAFVVLAAVAHLVDAMSPTEATLARGLVAIIGSVPFLTAVSIVAVIVIYRTLPPKSPAWSAIWLPSFVAGAAIVVLSQISTFLVPRLVGVAALAGSIASAFIALAWLSFSFQALLIGAAWVRIRDETGRRPPVKVAEPPGSAGLERPAPSAEPGGGGE